MTQHVSTITFHPHSEMHQQDLWYLRAFCKWKKGTAGPVGDFGLQERGYICVL